jgi:predicted PurR-regulated permease PerM
MQNPSDPDDEMLIGSPPSDKPQRPISVEAVALLVLAVLAVMYTFYFAGPVIFPILLATLIATPLRIPVERLARLGVPRIVSAAFIVVVFLAVIIVGVVGLSGPATRWVRDAPETLREVERRLWSVQYGAWADFQRATDELERVADGTRDSDAVQVELRERRWVTRAMDATGGFVTVIVLTVSFVFLLLAFGDRLAHSLIDLFSPGRNQRNIKDIFRQIQETVSYYLLVITGINAGLGVVIGTGMWLIGMPNPVLWGVMAALLNYIPFLGLMVGTTVVALVGIFSMDSLAQASLAPAIYLAANGLESNLITPTLLGRSLRLNVIFVFASIVLWVWLWGIAGALIAVPLLAILKTIFDHFESTKPLGHLLQR